MSSQKRVIRIVSALLTLSILFTSLPAVFAAGTTPFTDVRESDWFYDAVARAYDKKLFNGTSATTFSPNTPMTRAMLVTVLYRLDGERDTESMPNPFYDVEKNSWYTSAVKWAYCMGIVFGKTQRLFSPIGNITREQMATIIYRYTDYIIGDNRSVSSWDDCSAELLAKFSDTWKISEYAKNAIAWCYQNAIIKGNSNGTLAPKGNATRAEVATVLDNLLNYIASYTGHTHTYSITEPVPASCTESGRSAFSCECGKSFTYESNALGHNWGKWEVLQEPTDTAIGYLGRCCSRCGDKQYGTIPANTSPHRGTAEGDIFTCEIYGISMYRVSFRDDRNVHFIYEVSDFRTWGTINCSIVESGMLLEFSELDGKTRTILLCMPDEHAPFYTGASCAYIDVELYEDGTFAIFITKM